jgi:hypothetical protein
MTSETIELEQPASAAAAMEPVYVHIGVTDPDVVAALKEYEIGNERTRFVELALKVGVLSLRAAKGVIDGEQIKASGEQLIAQLTERLQGHRELIDQSLEGTLRAYFDPTSGHFAARVSSLTHEDGELSQLVKRQLTTESDKLRVVLDGFVGNGGALSKLLTPGETNPFVADLQKRMQQSLEQEHDAIIAQFSLDSETSALSRLVRELKQNHGNLTDALNTKVSEVVGEFSLDRPDSALSRLVGRVEQAQTTITNEFSLDHPESALNRLAKQLGESIDAGQRSQSEFQTSVLQILSSLQAQKKAEARSTTHGAVFEQKVGEFLGDQCTRVGDVLEDCGTTTGLIRLSKVGDFNITLGPDNAAAGASIVVEAKESSSYSVKTTLEECDEARRNRGSQVCLFVHSARTAPKGFETLSRHGHDIVVLWDAENDVSDAYLKAGLMAARLMCVRQAQQSSSQSASWTVIDKQIENMRKAISNFADLRTISETIERSAEKSLERIRIMSKDLDSSLATMEEHLTSMRGATQA